MASSFTLSLKLRVILYLRRYYGNDTIICPKNLIQRFHKTKGAISQVLKFFLSQNLIEFDKSLPKVIPVIISEVK